MTRASRVYIPGYVFHITHRCHKKEFLLKFKRDRDRYRYWLYEARKRYGLTVLNYVITSNHVHLLIKDHQEAEVSKGLQLVAGCMGREYNRRKKRRGAFWEDRYQLSIIEMEDYLFNCFIYIDLNMVRAGAVTHPLYWQHSGYFDIYARRKRYNIINIDAILETMGYSDLADFKIHHEEVIQSALLKGENRREPVWTEDNAIGSPDFVLSFKNFA
jgi:REP-associated tyrosine transposase